MRYELSIIALALGTVLAVTPAFSVEKTSTGGDAADLVRACKFEAVRGHFKHASGQRTEIEAHRRRMSTLCEEGGAELNKHPKGFLQVCKSEAAWGARHVHRGGSGDRAHMLRLQKLCEKFTRAKPESD